MYLYIQIFKFTNLPKNAKPKSDYPFLGAKMPETETVFSF